MDRALLVRPQPLRGEGLRGYFLRLSEVNGLLPEFDLHTVLPGQRRAQSIAAAAAAAATLGLDSAGIESLGCGALSHDGTRSQHRGHTISVRHLRGRQCAVCPGCLVAQSAVWADWELAAQVACPIHGCWLLDTCPGCKSDIDWRRQGVATCLCGYDFRCARATQAPSHVVSLAALVRHRLFGDLFSATQLRYTDPDFLRNCAFNELLGLFHFFRSPGLGAVAESPEELVHASRALHSQACSAMTLAKAISEWPSSWHHMLDRITAPARAAFPRVQGDARHIVSSREALGSFVFIRCGRVASEEFPLQVQAEAERLTQQRAVFAGHRRLFAASDLQRGRAAPRGQRTRHLAVTINRGHEIFGSDRLSPEAVEELFDASPYQVQALQRVGALPTGSWPTAADVDRGMTLLGKFGRARRRSIDGDMVPLSEIGVHGGSELEAHLRDVIAGRTPVVFWNFQRTLSLRNLFIPQSCTSSGTGQSVKGRE